VYDKQDGLTTEEMEQREINKRKMLGNIKFIGKASSVYLWLILTYGMLDHIWDQLLHLHKSFNSTLNITCTLYMMHTVHDAHST